MKYGIQTVTWSTRGSIKHKHKVNKQGLSAEDMFSKNKTNS